MAKLPDILPSLTAQQFNELKAARSNIFAFAYHIHVVNPIRGKVRFNLYPYQISVLREFIRHRFNIILKFRQAGITELISMYCLWLAMYHRNKNIVIISIKDRVAKKVLRKIKYMYKNLPPHLQVPVVNGRTGEFGTAQEMEFSNGSLISSVPTTEEAGRSEAVSLLVIDEAAIVRWASVIWAAAFPTLSTGGSAIVNSTPYGVGNWYHKQYTDALASGNDFNPIRLKWEMHPERDQEWYDSMRASLGPRRTAQEIDGDFLTSGFSVFDLEDIKAIEDMLSEYEPIEVKMNGSLIIQREARKGEQIYIGADIATGSARDYSAFTAMNRRGEEIACFKGKLPVNQFRDLLAKVGKRLNWATIAPEGNDIGLSVVSGLQDIGYPNLYFTERLVKEKGQRRPKVERVPGWYTNRKTRPVIIDELVIDVAEEAVTIKDPFFVNEAYTFIYDEQNRPVALGKHSRSSSSDSAEGEDLEYTDDAILAKAITNHIRKGALSGVIVAPR